MVFTKEDEILIKVLRQSKGYSARKLLEEFSALVQHWTDFCGRLTLQGLQTGSPACTRDMQVSVQIATTLSRNCNRWYCVRTAKATFPYWKLLFLSSIF